MTWNPNDDKEYMASLRGDQSSGMVLADPIEVDKIIAERTKLLEDKRRLILAVSEARNAYSLQAARDRADPDMVKGWRNLMQDADKLLRELGEQSRPT